MIRTRCRSEVGTLVGCRVADDMHQFIDIYIYVICDTHTHIYIYT